MHFNNPGSLIDDESSRDDAQLRPHADVLRVAAGTRTAMKTFAALAIVVFAPASAAAAPVQAWATVVPGGAGDAPSHFGANQVVRNKRALALDAEGNSYVGGRRHNGSNYDYYTQKFSPSGTLLWSATYNGPGNGEDGVNALVLDADGNVLVTGQSLGRGTNLDYATLKYSGTDGTPLWPAPARYNVAAANNVDAATALVVDANGDVLVTGRSFGSGTSFDYATLKYDGADGTPLWPAAARYNHAAANSEDQAFAIGVDASGGVFVTGWSFGAPNANADVATLKYSGADGSLAWPGPVRYNNASVNRHDIAVALAVDAAGDVVVAGYSDGSGAGNDFLTLKYAGLDGSGRWSARYNNTAMGFSDDRAHALSIDANGDVVVAGESGNPGTLSDFATLKYAGANGAPLWPGVARYDFAGHFDVATAVALAANGAVVVTGYSNQAGGTNTDYATLSYNGGDGAPRWGGAARHDGPGHGIDIAHAVAVDAGGDIRVAGTRVGGANDDFGLLRIDGVNGAIAWDASEGAGDGLNAQFGANAAPLNQHALAVDALGNSYVTGRAWNGSNHDYLTQKLDADGALVWSATYNGPGNGDDQAVALALDAQGDVIVTGHSSGIGTNADFATLKYSGLDGTPRWPAPARWDNAAANGNDQATALAVDAAGDIVVTGVSAGVGTGQDFATLKLDGADGTPRWPAAMRYDGDAHGDDAAVALALDAAGDIVVTGRSVGTGTQTDYATVKYAAADGAPLWPAAARYNHGAANGADQPAALAIALDGDVLVTGSSLSDASGLDYATLRYAGNDGAPRWAAAARYDGGAPGSDDQAQALVVDGAGDVYVTGSSNGAGADYDYVTLKYGGADGLPAWAGASRYNDAIANGADRAQAIALDGNGDVLVTGSSAGSGTDNDLATIKLSRVDGARQWEHRLDAGAAGNDQSFAIAVALDGTTRVAGTATPAQGERSVVIALREPRANANLASLSLAGQVFSPAFAPGTTAYASTVDAAATLQVDATAQDAAATIAIAGQPAQTGSGSRSVALAYGANPVALVVTAEDGLTQRQYTVTAYRAAIAFDPDSLAQTYNGTARDAVAVTQPAGLSHALVYRGIDGTVYDPSATPPTNAGRYEVTATIDAPDYRGESSATLVITRATGHVVFDTLAFTYDGNPKPVPAHLAEEPGVACLVPESPVGPGTGTFAVTATCSGANHVASGSADAVISPTSQGGFVVFATPASIAFGATSLLSTQGGGTGATSFAVTAGAMRCSLAGNVVTGTGLGTCTVTASKMADTNFTASTATVDITVIPRADLNVTVETFTTRVVPGETLLYVITVRNTGPNDVAGAVLGAVAPATLSPPQWECSQVQSSAPCPGAPNDRGEGTIESTFDLAAGKRLVFIAGAGLLAPVGTQIEYGATVTVPAGVFDPDLGNNTATSSLPVVAPRVFASGFEGA